MGTGFSCFLLVTSELSDLFHSLAGPLGKLVSLQPAGVHAFAVQKHYYQR